MSSIPIVKSFIENDGGSRVVTADQVQTSPSAFQFIPTSEGEEFELPSAAPASLDHEPLVVVVNGSSAFGLRLKIDTGQIHPEGSFVEVPPDRSVVLLATRRGLQGTDWSLVNLAAFGDVQVPGAVRVGSDLPRAEMTLATTDGKGRAHIYWNTQGGNSPTFTDGNEDAMRLTFHGSALKFYSADGAGKAAGDAIAWTRELEVGGGTLTVRDRELLSEIDNLSARVTALEAAAI